MVVFRASQRRGGRAPRDKHSAWAHERCGGAGVVGRVRTKIGNGRAHGPCRHGYTGKMRAGTGELSMCGGLTEAARRRG
jgi:hypothetical protein